MWKNLSHPNVLDLIGVSNTLEDGRLSMISEWMANGDIIGYVRDNAGNHLDLVRHDCAFSCQMLSASQLVGALEGLEYLHNANIAHGDLKGVSPPS